MEPTTLFYGTDARILTMSADVRQLYNNVCTLIIDQLYPKFLPFYTPLNNKFKELYDNNSIAFDSDNIIALANAMFKVRMQKISGWDNSIQVHNTRIFAYSDAINSFAGDKWGKIAYTLIKAAEILNWTDWSKDSLEYTGVQLIKSFAEGESQPVVLSSTISCSKLSENLQKEDNCIQDIKLSKEDFHVIFGLDPSKYNIEKVSNVYEEELNSKKNCIQFLYHGTDARLVKMSQEERNEYLNYCNLVIDYFWRLFEPYYSSFETQQVTINGNKTSVQVRTIEKYKPLFEAQDKIGVYYNLIEKLWMIETTRNGNEQYQYGDLYLTSSKLKARDYALHSFAGGELGSIAQRLILAAELMEVEQIDMDEKTRKAIETIKSFTNNPEVICPVIVKVPNIEIKYLKSDKGEQLEWMTDHFTHQDFRYSKKIELSLVDAEYLRNK